MESGGIRNEASKRFHKGVVEGYKPRRDCVVPFQHRRPKQESWQREGLEWDERIEDQEHHEHRDHIIR